jgi:predicted CXXCH cytochrome family protein
MSVTVVLGESESAEDYMGIGYCATCHIEPMMDWIESPHLNAFSDPEFQEEYEALGFPESCLSCHTTGFDEEDGTYVYQGVTCEECHGPGDTMNLDTSPELCANCHSGPYPTYEEWKDSGPSHLEATCTLCHDQHTAELLAETPTEICSSCHGTHLEAVEETKHGEEGVECADCHMYVTPPDFEAGIPGSTGHDFVMTSEELDCQTCHDRTLSKHDALGEDEFACLSCHGEIHSLELKLINEDVFPKDDSVLLCAQCHNERYTSWEQGTHGKPEDPEAQCVECHDPHDPVVANIPTLSVVPERRPPGGPSIQLATAFVAIVGVLGFAVVLLRWR